MQRPRLGGESADRAGRGHPQRQVEVLVVEEDALVEAADALERGAAKERGAAGRAERGGCRRGGLQRLPVEVVEAHQGAVGEHPGGVDQVRRPFLHEDAGDRVDPLAEGVEEGLDEARLALDVVVEQQHRVRWVGGDRAVQRRPEADVPLQRQHGHLGETLAQQLQRVVAGAVVDDDHLDRPALLAQAAQGPLQLYGAVEVGDVDGCAHRPQAPPPPRSRREIAISGRARVAVRPGWCLSM